ncbi:MAG: hypothetical protein H6961_06455 [Chromatiaceae bacterium]|nr:hypothetical protein [Gammaproteobacteria bacterium]MCP5414235.1 hypothetical protein [Chromatiaceae bacterium]MCW5587158.1 hypothetical protein [Chromatiales bacterium]MCB1818986.1 hypothetical protein [Gammaproteobacteria bacterium]MCP5434338.1 hypothetical protein [Chromatiaceae bacterium]
MKQSASATEPVSSQRAPYHWIRPTSLALALSLSACASLSPDLAAQGSVDVERQGSRDAEIATVRVHPVEGGLHVDGYLRRRFVARGQIPGHLHIQALSSNGTVLVDEISRYHRPRAKSPRSNFSQLLELNPEDVRTIRVVHHGLGDNDV